MISGQWRPSTTQAEPNTTDRRVAGTHNVALRGDWLLCELGGLLVLQS
jgi:hypothetical protein